MNWANLFNLQIMMFLEILVGYICRKRNIINEEGRKVLTNLVIDVLLPANIIKSFCIEFNMDILKNCIAIIAISAGIQVMCSFISANFYNKVDPSKKACMQYATVCPNSGFLGNPVAEGLYGSMGLLYASFYLIPSRIVMWSAGVSYFLNNDPSRKKSRIEVLKSVAVHPGIVSIYIGLPIMLFQLPLPGFLTKTLASLSGGMMPITMILIGAIMANADLRSMVTKGTLIFSFIRLVLIPGIVFGACLLCRFDSLLTGVAVILAAMPAGSTTPILAAQYGGDAEFASKLVVLTTLLSVGMIPVWAIIIGTVIG